MVSYSFNTNFLWMLLRIKFFAPHLSLEFESFLGFFPISDLEFGIEHTLGFKLDKQSFKPIGLELMLSRE